MRSQQRTSGEHPAAWGDLSRLDRRRATVKRRSIVLRRWQCYAVPTFLLAMCLSAAPRQPQDQPASDPLPSWNDGANKTAILNFVKVTTDQASPKFVPIAERIATFDNDGT